MYRRFLPCCMVLLFLSCFLTLLSHAAGPKAVHVSIHDLYPPAFVGTQENPAGFFPELLSIISEKENWQISYYPSPLDETSGRAENNRIDLKVCATSCKACDADFVFSEEPFYMDWATVYVGEAGIKSILDLDGRRIAVSETCFTTDEFIKLCKTFKVTPELVYLPTPEDILNAVSDRRADAGVVSHMYAMLKAPELDVKQSPIIFAPSDIVIAAPIGVNSDLLATVDGYLKNWKDTPGSAYYQAFNRWFQNEPAKPYPLPSWVYMAFSFVCCILAAFFVWNQTLKKVVRRRTLLLNEEITRREFVQVELSKALRKYMTLFNAFPHGITVSDPDGNIIETNPAAVKLLGVQKHDHEQRTSDADRWQIIRGDGTRMPPEEWAGTIALKENRIVSNFKMGILKPNQEVTWINATAAPLELEDLGVLVTYCDITEKRDIEKRLRKSEKQFRRFFENAGAYCYIVTPRGIILEFNATVTEKLGYTRDDLIGKPLSKLYAEEHADNANNLCAAWKATGLVRNMELLIKAKNGERHWVLLNADCIRGDNGRIVYSTSIQVDITPRKIAENALKQSEQKWRSYVQYAPYGVFITDRKGRFLEVNPAASSITGYTEAQLLTMGIADMLAAEDLDLGLAQFNHCIDKGASAWDSTFIHLNREKRHCTVSFVKLNDERFLGFARDITDRKKISAQMQQAQKMESIGNLAGGIAHDFNNILFPIIGMSEILLSDLPDECDEYKGVQQILKAANRGKELVSQILAFSRLSEQNKTPMKIQHVLKEVIKLSRATIPSDIEIAGDIDNNCGLVLADQIQAHQIAMNLITNAYHAIDRPGGKIAIALKETQIPENNYRGNVLKPGRYAMLQVSDNGCGIAESIRNKIFEPYFTTKEIGKGTGLGLAVVFGLARNSGGDVLVHSKEGEGTTFSVYIPLLPQDTAPAAVESEEVLEKGDERILLVDDDKEIANIGKAMLEHLGYTVSSFTCGVEAANTFKSDPDAFDAVVTDMTMPKLTGDQLAKQILAIRPELPVVLCTGYSEKIDEKKAGMMGIKGFLMKPAGISQLGKVLRRALDEPGAAACRL